MPLNPILILLVVLIAFAIFKANTSNSLTTSFTTNWNFDDLDITKNQNALRILLLLETNKSANPVSPVSSEVLQKPASYYGQFLQFFGTIKSMKFYTPHNNLESFTIGNSAEMIILTNDSSTVIDCFLIDYNSSLASGAYVTVCGYCPGLRYVQNSQGYVTPYLALIGYLESPYATSNGVTQSPTFPATSNLISPVSPNS